MQRSQDFDRYQKIAILIMALGEQEGAQILGRLNDQEVLKVVNVLKKMSAVSKEEATQVLKEFKDLILQKPPASPHDFARTILSKRFGEDSGMHLYSEEYLPAIKGVPGEFLARMTQSENPQVLAIIAGCCEDKQGAKFIQNLQNGCRADVIIRMAKLKAPDTEVLNQLNESLKEIMSKERLVPTTHLGGTAKAAKLLAALGNDSMATKILGEIAQRDASLAENIRDQMFTFEDLVKISTAEIGLLYRTTQKYWPIALIEASPELEKHILAGLSQGAQKILQEEREMRPKKLRREVEEARLKILEAAKELIAQGKITLINNEEYV